MINSMESGGILAVFAHPDDESFGPGGTLANWTKEYEVNVICVTDGNDPAVNGKLAEVRSTELREAAAILGINKVYELGYPDGKLCNALYHDLAAKIQEITELLKPSRLVTFEPRGVSGHIDHAAVALISSYVYERADYIREIWYYCESKDFTDKVDDYFIYFPRGFDRQEVDRVISVESIWQTKVKAMKAHAAQMKDVENILALKEPLKKEEYFFVTTKEGRNNG
jgi:LmbE family N-acetylglucosaminyl deacetylase